MKTNAQRKKPAKRAFAGLAGSSLAKVMKSEGKSDHALRVPKTPDRTTPTSFDTWFDKFGQKHGEIDLDCSFQDCAFDPHLGRGAKPLDNETPSHAGGIRLDDSSPLQDLGIDPDKQSRRTSFSTGLVEGDREIKRRRPGDKSWWIFDGHLLREFIQSKFNPDDPSEAEKAVYVLYSYYYENREDEFIYDERAYFDSVKQAKQYRQYIVKQGAERFKDQKPESRTWHGRRGRYRSLRCKDPNCKQCQKNAGVYDFSGREIAR